jgi:hypothetical protein
MCIYLIPLRNFEIKKIANFFVLCNSLKKILKFTLKLFG